MLFENRRVLGSKVLWKKGKLVMNLHSIYYFYQSDLLSYMEKWKKWLNRLFENRRVLGNKVFWKRGKLVMSLNSFNCFFSYLAYSVTWKTWNKRCQMNYLRTFHSILKYYSVRMILSVCSVPFSGIKDKANCRRFFLLLFSLLIMLPISNCILG